MRILFVENRYKTKFWELIARELIKDGHQIYWIVQHHLFKPKVGEIKVIPYFKNRYWGGIKDYTPEIKMTIQSNRGLNYFGIKSDTFVFYYQDQIKQAVETFKPDIAFGESTLFHEILTIHECKRRNILYLHPSSCRYPTQRFSFYRYDTLDPFAGSGEQWSDEEVLGIIDLIVKRSILPDYMRVVKPKLAFSRRLANKVRLSVGYYLGERFNTPSPRIKNHVERKRRRLIREWDCLAATKINHDNAFKILYPLQMQPEANIDVWGYPHTDQLEVIRNIVERLRANEALYIKPNPKSKYELSEKLLGYVRNYRDKIVILSHSCIMNNVFPFIDLVVTVTGTVSFECAWGDKPFISLGGGLQKSYSLPPLFEQSYDLVEGFKPLAESDKIVLFNRLVSTSYPGVIGDLLHGKGSIDSKGNMENIIAAFKQVIVEINK